MGWRIMGCGRGSAVKDFPRRSGREKENRASIHATLDGRPQGCGQRRRRLICGQTHLRRNSKHRPSTTMDTPQTVHDGPRSPART
ncbi:hypothetical protein LSAT2_025330 [Lamellibrachia satsuma]|nr:hypothetical protein LSAT2_025330 [Lamellibrachia satsuma]